MKITLKFEGQVSSCIEVELATPTRLAFAKLATALWHNYRDLSAAQEIKPKNDPREIVITGFIKEPIHLIKAIRELTGLGLHEAKNIVDAIGLGKPHVHRLPGEHYRKRSVEVLQEGGAIIQPLKM